MIYEKEPQTVLQSGAALSVHSIIHSIGVSFIEKTLNKFACGRVWVFVLGYIFVCLYKQACVCVCNSNSNSKLAYPQHLPTHF